MSHIETSPDVCAIDVSGNVSNRTNFAGSRVPVSCGLRQTWSVLGVPRNALMSSNMLKPNQVPQVLKHIKHKSPKAQRGMDFMSGSGPQSPQVRKAETLRAMTARRGSAYHHMVSDPCMSKVCRPLPGRKILDGSWKYCARYCQASSVLHLS